MKSFFMHILANLTERFFVPGLSCLWRHEVNQKASLVWHHIWSPLEWPKLLICTVKVSDTLIQSFLFRHFLLKVPYHTVFHQHITGLRYIQNMSLKCLAPNTKQIIAASHNPLCFSPVSKVLILCLLL